MTRLNNLALRFSLTLCAALALASPALAQTATTGSMAGTVQDQQGGRLPGVTVTAVHKGTGTTFVAVTQTDGQFIILNAAVGPYALKATLSGFRDATQDAVVSLGEQRVVDFKMELATVSENIVVTAAQQLVDTSQAGTAATISNQVKEALPTIARTMTDIVRVNPYVNTVSLNDDVPAPAIAGRNYRYNNIQIDGAVNNDVFGLAASGGTPGGATETAPISLDAIQELQVLVSPYDVRQGSFTGGGINAITKSGSNQYHGTAFVFGRNQAWIGDGADDKPIADFSDVQSGFSIGGPLRTNRAFFFLNGDWARKESGTGFSVVGSGSETGQEAGVDEMLRILRDVYNYDLGPNAKDEFIKPTDSNKIFVRGDFNVSNNHRLTVRHNYVDAVNSIGFPTVTNYNLPDNFYLFTSKTHSTVGQLNSNLGNAVNEFRITYSTIRDRRGGQDFEPRPFPMVDVTISPTLRVRAGRENFSSANELDQDILEIHDDYTLVRGAHTFTVGTHNEFYDFRNLFIRDNFGNYGFNSLANFAAGNAQSFDHSFSATSDPQQAARFDVAQWGFYAGDQWRVRSNVTITAGIRLDIPHFPDKPTANPVAVDNFGYATDIVPSPAQWSPRVGFNWDLNGDGKEQLRGGLGLFTGRSPYVWLSNQYGNTGIEFRRLQRTFNDNNNIPFVPDAFNQPKELTGGTFPSNEIDVVDPDFQFPQLLRGNLGYDREIWSGVVGTAEFLWAKNVNDVKYQNLNLQQVGTLNQDGRPRFARNVVPSLSNVILLTNTNEGSSWNLNFELKRAFRNGWYASGSYGYGQSTSILDGTNSQAASNWQNVYIDADPNNPRNTRSNFDPGHRISFNAAYDVPIYRGLVMTASVFYTAQSGRPWTLSYNRDVNGDTSGFNDNFYLPASASEVNLVGATYEQLRAFLESDDCMASQIGQIMERNSCRGPWTNTLDGRFIFGLPFQRVKAEITLDILNLINLFNSDKGLVQYTQFNQITIFTPTVSNGQITRVDISALANPNFSPYLKSDLRSRWQMQLGGRIRF
ncbi:MAG TPA: carboxypeptidase regulatory-like domain-containing protein [Vicinamibacterales bacterium]|nr:carboxypeptidase regulatory-like domain-containing protein [Vicinamibacterales bacterium]